MDHAFINQSVFNSTISTLMIPLEQLTIRHDIGTANHYSLTTLEQYVHCKVLS